MSLTTSQQKALVSLLEDGDVVTVNLVKQELIQTGAQGLKVYQNLWQQSSGVLRQNLQEVIERIGEAEALGNISRSLARLRTYAQLEDICWQLARIDQLEFDGGPYRRQLDQWAEEIGQRLPANATEEETVLVFSDYLAKEQQLKGNSIDYYHPRNCHLPWVIEFRSGLPITLTLIYILVGQRLGISIQGIGAPGHFLARLGTIIFDPYYDGRVLSDGEWDRICAEIPAQHRSQLNRATSPLQTIHRILLNLRNSFVKKNDHEGRRRIDHYLAVLQR